MGEVREDLDADYNGELIAIGFNPKYIIELLGQIGAEQISMSLGGELDPCLIKPFGSDDYLGVGHADEDLAAARRARPRGRRPQPRTRDPGARRSLQRLCR